MIDDISPPGSWVRELSARPHTYRDVWAALREAEARLAKVEAERDALRAALHTAAGMLSGTKAFSHKHPQEVLEFILDAAREAT